MHSSSRFAVFLVISIGCALACDSGGFSNEARREHRSLEGALGTLASANPEDRIIRLKELEEVEVHNTSVKELKELCALAYRAFYQAAELLDEARAKTQKVESKMAEARVESDAGGEMTAPQADELGRISRIAQASLAEVNRSLDRAEKLVESCEKKRAALRELASRP
ncbi:MAG: hypothetical protein GY847_04030 [Proteobacteria bacterium]|nr:hypothetical protein [Pseudomonadota bacterium]